jgi:gamma-glutamyl hercynylcysteine S-oxide synthase
MQAKNNPHLLNAVAQDLVNALVDARTHELELLNDLSDGQLLGPAMRIIEPPIWEMGHVGWFQEYWILRNLDGVSPIRADVDRLYDSFNIPNAERWQLVFPSRGEISDYITCVLDACIEHLYHKEKLTDEEV